MGNCLFSFHHTLFAKSMEHVIVQLSKDCTAPATTSLLDGRHDVSMQAAFGLVVTTTGLGTTVFNFLVDGVTAKVGRSVGAKHWSQAAGRVRMALLAAVVCGSVASATLLLAQAPLFVLFGAFPEVAKHARLYYRFRAAAVPLQCVVGLYKLNNSVDS